ncbi:hypothetical protein Tco_0272493 [Tanacetum coccineum]
MQCTNPCTYRKEARPYIRILRTLQRKVLGALCDAKREGDSYASASFLPEVKNSHEKNTRTPDLELDGTLCLNGMKSMGLPCLWRFAGTGDHEQESLKSKYSYPPGLWVAQHESDITLMLAMSLILNIPEGGWSRDMAIRLNHLLIASRDSHPNFWRSLQNDLDTNLDMTSIKLAPSKHFIVESVVHLFVGLNWRSSNAQSRTDSRDTEKIIQIKQRMQAASDRQKSYADLKRKPMEFQVGDKVLKIGVGAECCYELDFYEDDFILLREPLEEVGVKLRADAKVGSIVKVDGIQERS